MGFHWLMLEYHIMLHIKKGSIRSCFFQQFCQYQKIIQFQPVHNSQIVSFFTSTRNKEQLLFHFPVIYHVLNTSFIPCIDKWSGSLSSRKLEPPEIAKTS